MSKIKGIKIIAPLFDSSGYAEWSRGYALALHKAGIPVTLFPVKIDKATPSLGKEGEILASLVSKEIDYNVVISWNVPTITSRLLQQEPDSVLKIGFTLWETDKLPEEWIDHINNGVDECWLPGEFNRGVFKSSGVKVPIKTFDYPIDFSKYSSVDSIKLVKKDQTLITDDTYIFYFISQWSERKNFADLLQAYWAEFTDTDDVCLVLKTYVSNTDEDAQKLTSTIHQLRGLGHYKHDPEVVLITQLLSRDKVFGLHKRCDCYVSPSRGEGLGLGILEAGIFSNTVISNLFGEQASYIDDSNSYIYNYSLRPVMNMPWCNWYSADQYWAQPDIKGLATRMRACYETRDETRGSKLKRDLERECTYEKVTDNIIKSLEESLK